MILKAPCWKFLSNTALSKSSCEKLFSGVLQNLVWNYRSVQQVTGFYMKGTCDIVQDFQGKEAYNIGSLNYGLDAWFKKAYGDEEKLLQ